jgi:hypothetical protein
MNDFYMSLPQNFHSNFHSRPYKGVEMEKFRKWKEVVGRQEDLLPTTQGEIE